MSEFLKVAEVSDIPPGSVKHFVVLGHHIALCNVSGTFYALDNFCIHRGGPLSEGYLDGDKLECPWHGWKFDVKTGQLTLDPHMGVATYAVKINGSDVFVAIEA